MGDSDLASSMSLDEDLTVGCGGCSAMEPVLIVVMISRNPMGDGGSWVLEYSDDLHESMMDLVDGLHRIIVVVVR